MRGAALPAGLPAPAGLPCVRLFQTAAFVPLLHWQWSCPDLLTRPRARRVARRRERDRDCLLPQWQQESGRAAPRARPLAHSVPAVRTGAIACAVVFRAPTNTTKQHALEFQLVLEHV